MVFDPQLWGFDRQSNLTERQYKLIAAAADAAEMKRSAPRFELARFYLSRDMYSEAKGVLKHEFKVGKQMEHPAFLRFHRIEVNRDHGFF